MDRSRIVETALVELQSKQSVAKERSSTTSLTLTPIQTIQTKRTEQCESMRDFVQRLIVEQDISGPIVAPHNDDITKKVKIVVANFS